MKFFNPWALLLVFATSCVFGGAGTSLPSKPNIILIYGDDVGYGDLGCYGATAVQTPAVDRLAAGGLRFTSAYATAATCTPSRFSLLTGEYAFRQPGRGILPGDAKLIIQPGRDTLPSVLQRAGYHTAVIGKWHLGLGAGEKALDWNDEIKPGPNEVGFDYAFIMAATGDRVPCVYLENHRVAGLDPADPIRVDYQTPFPGEHTGKTHRNELNLDWSEGHSDTIVNGISRIGHMTGGKAALWQDDHMAEMLTQRATNFIAESRSRPFFLYLAAHDIHVPRVPRPDFAGQTSMGARGDAIVEFDWMVQQVISALERLNLLSNSIVIISSDNGPVLDDGYKDAAAARVGSHRPAGPWRAGKYSVFEGGTRVPLIVHWPAAVQPGVSAAIVSQVDFIASFAALTGQRFNSAEARDSQDQLAALLGRSRTGRQSVVLDAMGSPASLAFRQGDWKYIPPGRTRDGLGPWSQVRIAEPGFLFDLAADPGETNSVAARQPAKLEKLRTGLLQALDQNPGGQN